MRDQNLKLRVGDEIGFPIMGFDRDDEDTTLFLPVVEVLEVDGETAYRCQFPDGTIRRPLTHSAIANYTIKIKPQRTDGMICLIDRLPEFIEAAKRGFDWNLQVFKGWDDDTHFVRNLDNDKEYRVVWKTVEGKAYAECECADFIYRERICKHISEVLTYGMFRTHGN